MTFEMIRHGSYSAACDDGGSIDEARMLAGHRVSGMPDHQVEHNLLSALLPGAVAACVELRPL